jgi:hypothetical protein
MWVWVWGRGYHRVVDLGSIHLSATDSLLTVNFQFELDLDDDTDFVQSAENIQKFTCDFCENSNVRAISINKIN